MIRTLSITDETIMSDLATTEGMTMTTTATTVMCRTEEPREDMALTGPSTEEAMAAMNAAALATIMTTGTVAKSGTGGTAQEMKWQAGLETMMQNDAEQWINNKTIADVDQKDINARTNAYGKT